MGYDAAEMQDYVIGLQNQGLYNYNRYYGPGKKCLRRCRTPNFDEADLVIEEMWDFQLRL